MGRAPGGIQAWCGRHDLSVLSEARQLHQELRRYILYPPPRGENQQPTNAEDDYAVVRKALAIGLHVHRASRRDDYQPDVYHSRGHATTGRLSPRSMLSGSGAEWMVCTDFLPPLAGDDKPMLVQATAFEHDWIPQYPATVCVACRRKEEVLFGDLAEFDQDLAGDCAKIPEHKCEYCAPDELLQTCLGLPGCPHLPSEEESTKEEEEEEGGALLVVPQHPAHPTRSTPCRLQDMTRMELTRWILAWDDSSTRSMLREPSDGLVDAPPETKPLNCTSSPLPRACLLARCRRR